jgi:hypothetical protein
MRIVTGLAKQLRATVSPHVCSPDFEFALFLSQGQIAVRTGDDEGYLFRHGAG